MTQTGSGAVPAPPPLLGAGEVREVLARHDLTPSRALGQNFVVDPNTIGRIVRAAGVVAGDRVVEIGPGIGSLTVALAHVAHHVRAIELDRHLIPALEEVLAARDLAAGLEICNADATTLDWAEMFAGDPGPWKLVANLPYNVAATVVLRVLDEAPAIADILVMVQREVGERLAAAPGTAAYGIPSVKAQYWATVAVVGRVPASVFHPPPKVESVLVRMVRRAAVPAVDLEHMFVLVRAAFGQRRKMLRRSLSSLVSEDAFAAAGIDPVERPQDLSVDRWVALARATAPQDRPGPTAPR